MPRRCVAPIRIDDAARMLLRGAAAPVFPRQFISIDAVGLLIEDLEFCCMLLMSTTLLIDPDCRFRYCFWCCNQHQLIELLSSIADADAIASNTDDRAVADAIDPEL